MDCKRPRRRKATEELFAFRRTIANMVLVMSEIRNHDELLHPRCGVEQFFPQCQWNQAICVAMTLQEWPGVMFDLLNRIQALRHIP